MKNEKIIEILKKLDKSVGKIFWISGNVFDSAEKALASINFNTDNSGFYKPRCARVKGVKGFFLINKDGSLFFEQRFVKESENMFVIENLTSEGYSIFESEAGVDD